MADLIITPSTGKIEFIHQGGPDGQQGQTSRVESIIVDPTDGVVFSGRISASSVTAPLNIINVTAGSSNVNYPFIFASSGETGAKSLLMDSAGGTYNPSINTATIDVSGNSATTTLASNSTQLNGQAASYYTDINARLGYTPVNKAGDTVTGNLIINGNFSVNGSFTAFSASNVYISSSQLYIEDNILTLNAFSPYLRYAGVEMYDSGSGTLSSLLWDGEADYFFLTGSSVNGKIITGPDGQTNLTANFVPKATAGNKLGNSLIYDNGTNVGIGTTTVNQKLSIYPGTTGGISLQDVDNETRAYFFIDNTNPTYSTGIRTQNYYLDFDSSGGSQNAIRFYTGTSTIGTGTERMRIISNGNVGIGTTSPVSKLHIEQIQNAESLITLKNDRQDFGDVAIFGISAQNGVTAVSKISFYRGGGGSSGYLTFSTKVDNASSLTEKVRIDGAGNVGIGTTSPAYKLDVSGGSVRVFNNPTTNNWGLTLENTNVNGWGVSQYFRLYGYNSTPTASFDVLQIVASYPGFGQADFLVKSQAQSTAATVMSLLGNGNVGIGTTAPGARLEISSSTAASLLNVKGAGGNNLLFVSGSGAVGIGTTSITDGARLTIAGETRIASSAAYFTHLNYLDGGNNIISSANGGSTVFRGSSNNITVMTILGSGNVGIGTSSPGGKLEIRTDAASNYIFSGSSTSGYTTTFTMDDTASYFGHDSSVRSLILRTNSTARLTVKGDGNVGIGVTSPRVLLDLAKANNIGQVLLLGETGANIRVGFGLNPSNAGMRIFSYNHISDGLIEFGGISSDGSTWTRNHRLGLAGGNSFFNEQGGNVGIGIAVPTAPLHVVGVISGSSFTGAGTGLTGTAAGLSIGGNAATATTASYSLNTTLTTAATYPITSSWATNAVTALNGGVTSISAGTGIGTSASTGAVTITNSSPNATHTGDVTGATALTIANDAVTTVKILNANVTNAKLANSAVTIGSTAVSLGGTVTTFAGLASVTSTAFVGALTGNVTGNVTGTAGSETFATVTGRGASTTTQISVGTTAGGSMYTGIKSGAGYSDAVSGATFKSITDHPTGGSYAFAAYFNGAPGTGTNSFFVAADGTGYFKGNVGIGSTSPANRFEVVGSTFNRASFIATANVQTGIQIQRTGGVSNTSWEIYSPASSGDLRIYNVADYVTFKSGSGWVGIGTTSPADKLQVGAGHISIDAGYKYYMDANVGAVAIRKDGASMVFTVGATDKVYINESGNVGIGTSNATAKLESYYSSNAITFNYLATNLNGNSPIPVYGFDVTSGAESRSIKAGIGYERHETNGRGTMHFYNDSTNDTASLSGNRSSAGDIKMSINNVGNVGIGIVTPNAKLDVSGVIRGDAGANYPHSFTNTDAGNTHWTNRGERVLTSNGTNWTGDGRDPIIALVTSGNSNSLNIANSIGLTLHNESTTDNTFSPAILFSNKSNSNSYNTAYAAIIGRKTGQGVDANWSAGELHFYTMPVGAYINNIPAMMINSAGNVGIGTTSPAQKLDVRGYIVSDVNSNGSESGFYLGNSGHGLRRIAAGNDVYLYTTSGVLYIGTTGASSQQVTLLNSGNVGIGTTSPATLLHVDTAGADARIRVSAGSNTVQGGMIANTNGLVYAGSITNHGFSLRTNDTDRVRIQTDGNVGIGTTSPSSLLHLAGVGGDGVAFLRISGTASDAFNWGSSTIYANLTANETAINIIGKAQSQYNSSYIGYRHVADGSASNMLTLGLYAADYLVNILGNGNVGIGSTAPNDKLDVVGRVYAYRYIAVSSNASLPAYATDTNTGMFNAATNQIGFSISSAEKVRIDSNGNVGIGTTVPGKKLDVEGVVRTRGATGTGGFEIGAATTGTAKWRIEWDSASDSLDFNWVG